MSDFKGVVVVRFVENAEVDGNSVNTNSDHDRRSDADTTILVACDVPDLMRAAFGALRERLRTFVQANATDLRAGDLYLEAGLHTREATDEPRH